VWRKEPSLVPNMLLARAIERGDEAAVARTLPQVKALDAYFAEPPLVIAARRGHAVVVRQLLVAGAHAGREAALHVAVKRSDPVIVGLLLSAGTSAGAPDPATREQPLHLAAQYQASAPLIPVLVGAGADVDALDSTDRMPLQHAILACNFQAAKALIAAGANTSFALHDDDTVELSRKRCPGELAAITALASRKR
jgi:ankyrin repeat protein